MCVCVCVCTPEVGVVQRCELLRDEVVPLLGIARGVRCLGSLPKLTHVLLFGAHAFCLLSPCVSIN